MWKKMIDKTKMTKFKDRDRGWHLPVLLLLLAIGFWTSDSYLTNSDFSCTFEKPICRWRWNFSAEDGYQIMSGDEALQNSYDFGRYSGPSTDSENQTSGHYLNLLIESGMREVHVWSSRLSHTSRRCKISVWLHMLNMTGGHFRVVVDSNIPWVIGEVIGNNRSRWEHYEFTVGRVTQEFRIILVANAGGKIYPAHLAVDQIELINCFPEVAKPGYCTNQFFICSPNTTDFCLNRTQLCDIRIDCLNGADEKLGCDKVPSVGRCDFENDWCGWQNSPDTAVNWTRIVGVVDYKRETGPAHDRTYRNVTGRFMYANMSDPDLPFGAMALLDSSIINPPPLYHSRPESDYYQSCHVRFFFHQFGRASGSIALYLIEHEPHGDRSVRLFYTYGDKGDSWVRGSVVIPTNLRNTYHLQFEVRRGLRAGGDVAVDDVSMSRECFGLNVPENIKEGYNYDTFKGFPEPTLPPETHEAFINKTVYTFTTCGSTGRTGPTPENCTKAYNNTHINVTVIDDPPIRGVQKWIVPETNFYTIIAKGAAGGAGPDGRGTSQGAAAVGIIKLYQGMELHMLVGQEGSGGCRRNFAMIENQSCGRVIPPKPTPPGPRYSPPRPPTKPPGGFDELRRRILPHSGGGGGGGTFVYVIGRDGKRRPIIIGGGGGGLGGDKLRGETAQNGRGIDPVRAGITGQEFGVYSPGAGGGWNNTRNNTKEVTGASLLDGAIGGHGCGTPKDYHGMGGFGGGGGGCISGGGGGGFTGGSASALWRHGRGGYSFLALRMRERNVLEGNNNGPGAVVIIPAITGCGCEYLCAAVDEYLEEVKCICQNGQILEENMANCEGDEPTAPPPTNPPVRELHFREEVVYAFLGTGALSMVCLMVHLTYKCIRRVQKRRRVRRNVTGQHSTTDIQLHRLRQASENMMTEQNPTYEVTGPNFDRDLHNYRTLPEIPRDSLRFDGALGQGAFGEVYRGYYKVSNEGPDMPVAVKTLPAFSSVEAESDFFMEAMIMNKFNHPNIVRLIGVCFERHPRFIILELLHGGDLKNFLRDNRPHAGDPNKLTIKDLLKFARDVAQGCVFLEERRFIHRDIAARNCLLTSKGEDKTVKIGDFGMAKDIYRSDYYRKAGRAMLPVKWMPPEAFQDGVFTTKTDVWSYGVFLWEVMTVGFMPYTGRGNRQVMQMVVRGGRLECPKNCPNEIYAIMRLCWQRLPMDRPSFAYIRERIGYCLQDPAILKTKLPLFTKAAKGNGTKQEVQVVVEPRVEVEGRPDTDDDFEEDDDDGVIAEDVQGEVRDEDEEADAIAAAIAASQITYAETVFSDPQPGTSKGDLGKNSHSDSVDTIFVVPSDQPITDPPTGLTGWVKRGKSKSFNFARRERISEVPLDPGALELPVISATRGPLGPKGRLKPSELMKYRDNIATIGRIDREEIDSVPSDEDSTYC